MKSVGYEQYGSPKVLKLREIEKPSLADYEMLVGARAAHA